MSKKKSFHVIHKQIRVGSHECREELRKKMTIKNKITVIHSLLIFSLLLLV